MEKLITLLKEHIAALVLPLVILVGAILPTMATAGDELALDRGRRGGGEGDPLDTNDAGGGDDPSDEVQDSTATIGTGFDLLDQLMRSGRIMIVPQYNGSVFTLKFIVMSDSGHSAWGRNAK